jgi:hypothetical protein
MMMVYCNDTINARKDMENLKCLFYNKMVEIQKLKKESLISLSNGTGYNSMGVCRLLKNDMEQLLEFEKCDTSDAQYDNLMADSDIEYSLDYVDHRNGTLLIELRSSNPGSIAVFENIAPSSAMYTMSTDKMTNKTMCKPEREFRECNSEIEIEDSLFVNDYIFGPYQINISDIFTSHQDVSTDQFVYNNTYNVILNQLSLYKYEMTIFKVVRHEEAKKCYCRRVRINENNSWMMNCTSLYNRTCRSTKRVDITYETLAVFSSANGVTTICKFGQCVSRNNHTVMTDSKAIEYEKNNPHRFVMAPMAHFVADLAFKQGVSKILEHFKIKKAYNHEIDEKRLQDDFFVRELYELFPREIDGEPVIRRIKTINVYVLRLPPDLFSTVMTFRLVVISVIYMLILFLVYLPICLR